MAAQYPGAIATTPTRDDADMSATTSHKTNHDRLWEEVRAIQQALATSPTQTLTAVAAALPTAKTTWSSPIAGGITVGNGSVFANYVRVGPLVVCQLRFTMGSTSSITGNVTLTVPTAPLTNSVIFGTGWVDDVSVGGRFALHVGNPDSGSTSTLQVRCLVTSTTQAAVSGSSSQLSSTVPFTWATGDQLAVTFTYLPFGV